MIPKMAVAHGFLGGLVWLIGLLGSAPGNAWAQPRFAADIERARLDSLLFREQYAREMFDYNRALFAEITSCYQSVSETGKAMITENLAILDYQILALDGQTYVGSRVLGLFGFSIPLEVYAAMGYWLELAHSSVSELCLRSSERFIGERHLQRLLDDFTQILQTPVKRLGLQMAFQAVKASPHRLKRAAMEMGIRAAGSLVDTMPFLAEPWFPDVALALSESEPLMAAAETLLYADSDSMAAALRDVFAFASPYEINYPELWASNKNTRLSIT